MCLPCMKVFQVKGRTRKRALKPLLAVRGKHGCVPVSDPYSGNGLSSGSLLTITRWVIVANSKQERVKLKPVKNDTILIFQLTIAERLSGQVFSPYTFL